jgi:hypothetical protein
MTILESRLFASISQQESKSDDINSLRVKQKDMEAIINKKDEVICKLNEEIQYIQTKLLSLERVGTQNNLANKGRGLINHLMKFLTTLRTKTLARIIMYLIQ